MDERHARVGPREARRVRGAEQANAKPKRVNPKKKKGRAAKPQVITVDCAKL